MVAPASSVRGGKAVRGLIVWTPGPGMLKAIGSAPGAALASRVAWRRGLGPESLVFVTVKVAAGAAVTESRRKQTNAWGARFLIPMKCLEGRSFGPLQDLFL